MKYEIYKNLSKEEKKKVRLEYLKTKKGDDLMKRYNRLTFTGILCIILALLLIYLLIFQDYEWYYILLTIGLLICAPIFLIGQYNLRMQQYCRFITLNKKGKLNKGK